MVGFYDHYEPARVQIIGKVEYLYLHTLTAEERHARLEDFFKTKPVSVIYTTSLSVSDGAIELAEKYGVAYLYSDFKKGGGYLRSCELSKEYGLYRQDFCGCVYSQKNQIV